MDESLQRELAEFKRLAARKKKILLCLAAVLLLLIFVAAGLGASSVNHETLMLLLMGQGSDVQRRILLHTRLPRILAAVFSGAALSLAGLLMQGVFQNALVSPYTVGVSGGASFGACLAICLGAGAFLTPAFAFGFAMIAMVLVLAVSRNCGGDGRSLVLTGVAVGYLFSALVSALKYFSDAARLPELVFWTMGSLTGLTWPAVGILAAVVGIAVWISMAKAWDFNALSLGWEEASALGVNSRALRSLAFALSALLTAAAVSFTGVIGFVGLVAPHVVRMCLGGDHRYNIPASVLLGGSLLLLADTLARTLIAPTELPVGIVTSCIGVPFYLYLVILRRKTVC